MSWLNINQSLNSIKGQITNFASEVLSESVQEDAGDGTAAASSYLRGLEEKCRLQESEIASLKHLRQELREELRQDLREELRQELRGELRQEQEERNVSKRNGIKDDDSSWYWDPQPSSQITQTDESDAKLQIQALQNELYALRERCNTDLRPDSEEEIHRLREENKNLTNNLDDLDNQHQLAMERLLTLKKELQRNFEFLKQEHEDLKSSNDDYANENKILIHKIGEKDDELLRLSTTKQEYDTLQHKYQNLEKIHSLLRENAEKFQEENQELHEEIFKLQEKVTKLEHELEIATKSNLMVPKEKFDDLLEEYNNFRQDRKSNSELHNMDEINIDDNAKGVIESLKRELHEIKHKASQKQMLESQTVKADKIMHLYSKYVNFELPVDYIGEIPSSEDGVVLYKLESVFKTLNSFKKQIDILDHKLSEKTLNMNHLQTQIDDLTTENDFLTTDLQHFERELNEMKKNNDFLISEIAALKNTSKLEPIIETHEDNLVKLETELADCTRINKTFESEIVRIEKELATVITEKTKLQESLRDLKEKYTLMLNELEVWKNQTKALQDLENVTMTVSSNETCDKLNKAVIEIDELNKKLSSTLSDNEQLSIDIHIIENDKVLLTKELDDLKHELQKRHTEHKDLVSLKVGLENKLQKLENKIDEVIKHKMGIEITELEIDQKVSILEDNISKTYQHFINNDNKSKSITEERKEQHSDDNTKPSNYTSDDLTTELNSLKSSCNYLSENNTLLQQVNDEMKAKIVDQESLSNEIKSIKDENKNLLQTKLQLEVELSSTDRKIIQLEQDFDKLLTELNEKDSIIDESNATIARITNESTSLQKNMTQLESSIKTKNDEIEQLSQSLTECSNKLSIASENSTSVSEELGRLSLEKEDLSKQIFKLNDEISAKNSVLQTMHTQLETLEKLNAENNCTIDLKEKEIKELNQSIVELTDKIRTTDNTEHQNDEYAKLWLEKETIEKQLHDLSILVSEKENEITDIKCKYEHFENMCLKYKMEIDNATAEKTELISLVTLKHNESIQYHNEIQRLNRVLQEQTTQFNSIIEEKDKLVQNNENCSRCQTLRVTLKEKDEIIMSLNQNVTDYEKVNFELLKANETIQNLAEKCEHLDKSLGSQLETVRNLTAKNVQVSEAEEGARRELERLRQHLVETEETHTQELMAAELKLGECQARLHQLEERAKHTTTLYTSNSIRANQEVETLRNQIKLLERQREEMQARLSDADDARRRSEAALVSLQLVLEQFQLDKERDVEAATEKLRNRIEELKRENQAHLHEIARLNLKLEESLAGLQAATRLGDQVETKTAQINDLKEQIRALQASVAAAEERYRSSVGTQQDKVDKHLVKNLLLNYVLSASQNNSNRLQVLHLLSTVLDFNQQECERAGLATRGARRGGAGGGAGGTLAAEFVKFLQTESTPRAPLPNMMTLTEGPAPGSGRNTPASTTVAGSGAGASAGAREPGHSRNTSTGSNNLLLHNLDAVEPAPLAALTASPTPAPLDTGVTQARNTESAILKHVLRDT